jgi:signal transduction histidine kinase
VKWEQIFPTVRGFHPATGQRVMQERIADWVTEAIEARVANRMAQHEESIRKEIANHYEMVIEAMESILADSARELSEAETVIAMQETTLKERFEALQTAEETIDTLRVEVEAYEMDAEDDDGGDE